MMIAEVVISLKVKSMMKKYRDHVLDNDVTPSMHDIKFVCFLNKGFDYKVVMRLSKNR